MPLGPFRVEILRVDDTIPQRPGYETKAKLLNAPVRYNFPVAGISYRQNQAAAAVNRSLKSNRPLEKRAELIYEDTNKFDLNAVAVYIFGEHVGYLPRGLCAEYRSALSCALPQGPLPMFCPFIFIGGGPGIHIGVRLALPKSLRTAASRKKTVGIMKTKGVEYAPNRSE